MENKKRKIVFIIHALSQPRCIKRVTSLYQAGFDCVVYGYNRGNYDVNTFPEGIKVSILGEMQNGNNQANLKTARKNLRMIIEENGRDCLYYTFGFLASLLMSFKRVPFVYEISDVLYAYPKYDKVRWLMKMLDKHVINKAKFVVMTSGGFQRFYGLDDSKVILLPNRVDQSLKDVERSPINNEPHPLRFAFVGAIRYDAIFRFAQTIGEQYPQYEFHFYGGAPEKTMERVRTLTSRYSNILYHGPFKSPGDLSRIYNEVDVVVACYDTNSLNERIAEPNKLYEAMLFCRPIVVSEGTYLAQRVSEYGCGFAVNPSSKEAISSFIKSLTLRKLIDVSEHELKVKVKEVVNDSSQLIEALNSIKHND